MINGIWKIIKHVKKREITWIDLYALFLKELFIKFETLNLIYCQTLWHMPVNPAAQKAEAKGLYI